MVTQTLLILLSLSIRHLWASAMTISVPGTVVSGSEATVVWSRSDGDPTTFDLTSFPLPGSDLEGPNVITRIGETTATSGSIQHAFGWPGNHVIKAVDPDDASVIYGVSNEFDAILLPASSSASSSPLSSSSTAAPQSHQSSPAQDSNNQSGAKSMPIGAQNGSGGSTAFVMSTQGTITGSSNLSSARSISGSETQVVLATGASLSTTGGSETISSTSGSQTQQASALPNTSPLPSNPSSGRKTRAIIIGTAVAGVVLLVLILLGSVWWRKRRGRQSPQLPTHGISSLASSMGGEPALSRSQRTSLFQARAVAPAYLVPYDLKPVCYTSTAADNSDLHSTCNSVTSSTEKPRITSLSTVASPVLDSDNGAVSPTVETPQSVRLSSSAPERQPPMQQEFYEELRARVHQMERSSDATAQNVQRMLEQIVSLFQSDRHHGLSSEPPPGYD